MNFDDFLSKHEVCGSNIFLLWIIQLAIFSFLFFFTCIWFLSCQLLLSFWMCFCSLRLLVESIFRYGISHHKKQTRLDGVRVPRFSLKRSNFLWVYKTIEPQLCQWGDLKKTAPWIHFARIQIWVWGDFFKNQPHKVVPVRNQTRVY